VQAGMTPSVSIVIASHRGDYIARCLQAFGEATWGSLSAEIIVVADYPIEELSRQFPAVTWLFLPDRSISAKRNRGVVAAKADVIGFIDDDCRALEGWIEKAASFLEHNPDAAGVEGLTVIETPDKLQPSFSQFKRLEKHGYRSNNMFYRRRIFVEAGMFDERFTVQREDIDLAFTILERGHRIGYDEEVKVVHAFRPNEKWDLLKNCVNRRFDPLLYRKHPGLYRKHIRSPFTPSIGLLLFCYCVTAAWAALRMPALPVLVGLNLCTIAVVTARRAGSAATGVVQWLREYLSYALSPVVLLGALLYGNARFRAALFI